MRIHIASPLLLTLAFLIGWNVQAQSITVEAGDFDRRNTVVAFEWPGDAPDGPVQLVDQNEARYPVQRDLDGHGWFILDNLPAGAERTFRFEPTDHPAEKVKLNLNDGAYAFAAHDGPVFTYQAEEVDLPQPDIDSLYVRGGYLHPVYTPSGRVVTDDYPADHIHHHGIWAAWTNTVYEGRTPDFWNMGQGTGKVEADGVDVSWTGPIHGGVVARHRYVDLSAEEPETVLNEQWAVRAYNLGGGYRMFDLELEQTLAGDSALVLPEYRYGGVGFRGRGEWNGPENTDFLTSEGKDRSNGHATRARWCHIGGDIDGTPAGIAMLDHPENFESPQPMRIHPSEPFFNYAPSQAGDWSIEPGEPYLARYRFIVYDGEPDPELIDRLWNDYAHPPVVSVTSILSDRPHVSISFEKQELSDLFYGEGATFGDLNGDDVMDIISGPFWYEGPDYQTVHAYYRPAPFDPAGYSDNFFPYVYDFNEDGWSDILIIGFPGEDATWYENPGTGEAESYGYWTAHRVFDGVDNESPTWTDLTGDGRPEIVCISEGRYGYVLPDWSDPARPWTFHPISSDEGWQRYTHGLGVGDVNGDGRMDLMERGGWWEQPESLEGDPVWTRHEVEFAEGGGAQMYAYDVDGDGDNDVITSLYAHGYGLAWFEHIEQDGEITFERHMIMNEKPEENPYGIAFAELHALDLVDMDDDGVLDLVTGKRWLSHGVEGDPDPQSRPYLYWFNITRAADGSVEFVPYLIDDDTGVGVQVVTGDINGDDLPDVVVGNKKGTAVLFHQRADQPPAQ